MPVTATRGCRISARAWAMRRSRGAGAVRLQGIAGTDEPPDAVEGEPLQRLARHVDVAFVRRVEGAAEEAHRRARRGEGHGRAHGRHGWRRRTLGARRMRAGRRPGPLPSRLTGSLFGPDPRRAMLAGMPDEGPPQVSTHRGGASVRNFVARPPCVRSTPRWPRCARSPNPLTCRAKPQGDRTMASYQYVYHMDGVSKTYPGGKKVFENIRLSFLPGVKIGVVGVNGTGKSTLMRIMAGARPRLPGRGLGRRGGEAWATCRRSPSSTRRRPCARTSCWAWRPSRPSSTGSTSWP